MVLVGGRRLDTGEDGLSLAIFSGDESGDVVDVTVGVVSGAAAVQPHGLIDAEMVVEGPFKLLARDAGIALLHL